MPESNESKSGRAAVQLKPTLLPVVATMIRVFKGPYGSIADLRQNGEIQGYEFLDPPIEYRFLRAGVPISDWPHQFLDSSRCCEQLL
jgi:hypothetical protein